MSFSVLFIPEIEDFLKLGTFHPLDGNFISFILVMRLVGEEKVTLLQKFLKQSKLNVKEVLEKEQKKDCEDEEEHGPGTNRDIRVLASLDAKINRIKEKKEGLEKQIESTRPSNPVSIEDAEKFLKN